ncbi:MAG: hypothetical protein PHO56_04585 [Patescibacteria group bacterium]|nr:hypothetical protein [Patescibacteria group bacterium]
MDNTTINPFKLAGSYLGTLAGLLLFLKGWHIFWWLPPLIGLKIDSLAGLDMAGGFIAGYVLHILWRVGSYHAGRMVSKK